MPDQFKIGTQIVKLGEKKNIELNIGRLYDYTELTLPIQVIRGTEPGPTMFISGAIHGDETIGVAIVKSIINDKRLLNNLKGTLIAIPIVNVFGFNANSRYLPDRKDLNRCFPGSDKGSLGSIIAHTFMKQIIPKCQFGIDFHSGAIHRSNLPQIRTSLELPLNKKLAEAFGVPVVLDSKVPEGSLREAAVNAGLTTLLFEGGEALRINEKIVKIGVEGAFSVMTNIGMLANIKTRKRKPTYFARSAYWVRAPQGGMMRTNKLLGTRVREGMTLGNITDAFGKNSAKIIAPTEGVIIGISKLPLVNRGDAVFHIATFEDSENVRNLAEDVVVEYANQY